MTPFFVHLFHILFVGGLFLYVGTQRTSIPEFMYRLLFALGIIIFLYHAYRAYSKVSQGKNPWVNLIHMFIVAPVLLAIGTYGNTTPRYLFEILLMLGIAATGYHAYYMVV